MSYLILLICVSYGIIASFDFCCTKKVLKAADDVNQNHKLHLFFTHSEICLTSDKHSRLNENSMKWQMNRCNINSLNHAEDIFGNFCTNSSFCSLFKPIHFNQSALDKLRDQAKSMFMFGYDCYMKCAFPEDELNPLKCSGRGPDTKDL